MKSENNFKHVFIINNNIVLFITKLIIDILVKLKIKNFFISFSIPTLVSALEKDFNLDKKQLKLLIENFKNKNLTDLDKISDELINETAKRLADTWESDDAKRGIEGFLKSKRVEW